MSQAKQKVFSKKVIDWLTSNGAVRKLPVYDGDTSIRFQLPTTSGMMDIRIPEIEKTGMYGFEVFCQFETEVSEIAIARGANPRTGKMNFHFSPNQKVDPMVAADYVINDLDALVA